MSQVDQAHDGIAIDGERDGLAEAEAAQKRLMGGGLGKRCGGNFVEIEQQEVVFQARANVLHHIAAAVFFQDGEVARAYASHNIGVTRLESHHLAVFRSGNAEIHLIQIRKPVAGGI